MAVDGLKGTRHIGQGGSRMLCARLCAVVASTHVLQNPCPADHIELVSCLEGDQADADGYIPHVGRTLMELMSCDSKQT